LIAMLAIGALALADEAVVVDESTAEIAARAEESAGDLAVSVRALEGSLSSAAPAAESRLLSAEENDALVEAGMKQQLAGLADELDQLSAALAAGADPATEKALFTSLDRRAAALSQLGARSSRAVIPPELLAELLALRNDVRALSTGRPSATVEAPADEPQVESAP
jgi:hypothetical protein